MIWSDITYVWIIKFQKEIKTLLATGLEVIHSCDTLVKNLTEFCLYPENLHKAEFKSNRLINIEEISGQYNTKRVTFFLLIILMQIHTEKEQQVGQKEVKKMCDLERKVH